MTRVTIIGEGPTEDYALPALVTAIRKWRERPPVALQVYTRMKTRGSGMMAPGPLAAAIATCRKSPAYQFDRLILHCDCDDNPRHEQQHITRVQIAAAVVPTWSATNPCPRCRTCYLLEVEPTAVAVVPVEATEAWEYVLAGQAGDGRGIEDLERRVVYERMFGPRSADSSTRARWARESLPQVLAADAIGTRLDDLHRNSRSFRSFVVAVDSWP